MGGCVFLTSSMDRSGRFDRAATASVSDLFFRWWPFDRKCLAMALA